MTTDGSLGESLQQRLFRPGRLPFVPALPSPLSLTVERLMTGVFVVGLFILGAVGLVAYQSTLHLVEVTASVSRSWQTLETLDELLSMLYQAESTQRAYLLTAHPDERERYAALQSSADAEVGQLRALLADDPDRARQVDALEAPIRRRLDLLEEGFAARDAGGVEASVELVRRGVGSAVMRDIRERVDALAGLETGNLTDRRAVAAERARATQRVIGAGVLFALLMVAAASVLIRRQLRIRRRAEATAARLVALVESSEDAIVGATLNGRIVSWNRGAEELYGYAQEEAVGAPADMLVPEEERERWRDHMERIRRGDPVEHFEATRLRKDGRRVVVSIALSPVRDDDGRVIGASGIARDITERREIERMKDEFVSVVSHELRTPLTAIRGSLGLVAGGKLGPLPERADRLISVAASNTDRLVRLINDILDVERIAAGKAPVEREHVDAATLMRQAEDLMRPIAEKAGVRLAVEPLEAPLFVDPDRMVQVFTNLLGNAIKFSPAGAAVRLEGERRDGEVRFRVEDRGRGIPPEKLESIFGRFQQVDTTDSREKGGTGLGLAICRGLVELHGGRIWAESEPGEGSTFTVVVPAESEAAG